MKKVTALCLLALICSCAKTNTASTVPAETKQETTESAWNYIENSGWKLIQMNGKETGEFQPTIQFDRSKSTIFGSDGCNRYFGTFSSSKDSMTLKLGGTTMMMCPPPAMETAQIYSGLLTEKTYTYDLADQVLNFYENGKIVLMFGKTEKEQN